MTAFRHIVVGLDTSPATGALGAGSEAALACARWLARGESVRCTLLHSTCEDELFDPAEGAYVPSRGAASADPAVAAAADALREAGIATQVERSSERAWLAITRRVLEAPADGVIVGKRTEAEDGGPRLGSVAAKLLRKCPCPVWAVLPGGGPPARGVLAACDLTPVGEEVLERASQLALRAQVPLHVVHSVQLDMQAQLTSERDALERECREAERRLRAVLARVDHRGPLELHVGQDAPTRAILAATSRCGVDLVVMGTIARGGLPGLLLGNTAERLLQRLPVSLLTLKPADFVCPVDPARAD